MEEAVLEAGVEVVGVEAEAWPGVRSYFGSLGTRRWRWRRAKGRGATRHAPARSTPANTHGIRQRQL